MRASAFSFCCFFLTFFLFNNAFSLAAGRDHEPKSPFLLVTASQINQIRKEIAEPGNWKQKSWLRLQKIANDFLNEKLEIPTRGGNWEQYYIGSSGYGLIRGNLIGDWQWEHRDTTTGQILTGDKSIITKDYDGIVIGTIHNRWAIGALQLGLAYQISGNTTYARKAKEILLAYAAIYPSLPERNKKGDTVTTFTGKGKIHVQNLNEAEWLIDIVQGADLIWETLTAQERRMLIKNIFYPAVKVINEEKSGILNIQCWKNAATGMVGLLTHDQLLINKAITDTATGYYAQINKGVTAEGFWIDRSPTYHFFALEALIQLARATKNSGYPIDISPLHNMLTCPLSMCNPAFSIPPFNDSKTVDLRKGQSHLYEWGYAEFKDENFLKIIKNPRRPLFENEGPSFTGWALLFGQITLPNKTDQPGTRQVFPETGIGILSKGTGFNNITCYIKVNPQTGAHTHSDELDIALTKGTENILALPGIDSYASPLTANWYRTSVAHNTFSINHGSQHKSTGKIISSGDEKGYSYIIAETDNAYDSLQYIRAVSLLSENLLLIIDQIELLKRPQLFDIAFHLPGTWQMSDDGDAWTFPQLKGYNCITNAFIKRNLKESYLPVRTFSGKTIMQSSSTTMPMDVITGYSIPYKRKNIPVALYRMKLNKGVFATCISTNGKKVKIQIDNLQDEHGENIPLYKVVNIKLTEENGKVWNIILNPRKIFLPVDGEAAAKDFSVTTLSPGS